MLRGKPSGKKHKSSPSPRTAPASQRRPFTRSAHRHTNISRSGCESKKRDPKRLLLLGNPSLAPLLWRTRLRRDRAPASSAKKKSWPFTHGVIKVHCECTGRSRREKCLRVLPSLSLSLSLSQFSLGLLSLARALPSPSRAPTCFSEAKLCRLVTRGRASHCARGKWAALRPAVGFRNRKLCAALVFRVIRSPTRKQAV